jgi:LacI family transcriptional regulator
MGTAGTNRDADVPAARPPGARASLPMVAERAGVSLGTASNVLNRPHLVSEATRERVLRAMEDLDYVPNVGARQLRQGRSHLIGVLVLDISNPFWGEVVRGAEAAAVESGHVIIVCNAGESTLKEDFALRALTEHRVDGLLIAPVAEDEDRLERLQRSGMQVVLLDYPSTRPTLRSVAVNDIQGGRLAAGHLLDLGHTRVAFVGSTTIHWGADRHTGVAAAFEDAGLDPDEHVVEVLTSALTSAEGDRAADEIARMDPMPTAVVCVNDVLALGVLRGLHRNGLRVPQDISLVGYDDVPFAAVLSPPLTTIQQLPYRLGETAAQLMLDAITGQTPPMDRHVLFEPKLIVRDSTAPPPVAGLR